MKEKFWYFGYVVALLLILLIAFTDFPSGADMALAILFTCVFSVTHTQLLHRRMLHTDSSYRINVLDERNIAIKEKAGNITNMITLMLLGIAMLIFITLNYMVSAIIVGVIILIQPLVLIIASSIIEKKSENNNKALCGPRYHNLHTEGCFYS